MATVTRSETVVFHEARRRAARALLDYCEARSEENELALVEATHNLQAAALVARAPSQQDRATQLALRERRR